MQRSYRSQVNHGESGNSAFVENSARGNYHLPEAQALTTKSLARFKIVPIPWPYWRATSVAGSHVITFQIADEIRLIFKEVAAVGSRKYQ